MESENRWRNPFSRNCGMHQESVGCLKAYGKQQQCVECITAKGMIKNSLFTDAQNKLHVLSQTVWLIIRCTDNRQRNTQRVKEALHILWQKNHQPVMNKDGGWALSAVWHEQMRL